MASGPPEYLSSFVHQATGIISVQVGCNMGEGLNRLRILAASAGQTLDETAHDVIDHIIRLDR